MVIRRGWLVAVLSGAALAVFPGVAPSAGAPITTAEAAAPITTAEAAALPDDGSRVPDGSRPGHGEQPGGPTAPGRTRAPQPAADSLCRPGLPPDAPQTTQFYDDNRLLGPTTLPSPSPVGPLLAGYQRFGAQSEAQWVRNYTANGAGTALVFPPENGFFLGPDGKPVKQRQTMLPGYRLDRFGFPGGAFLAPLGTPFGSRSLAPQSLNTPPTPPATTPPAPLANYHTYCVLKLRGGRTAGSTGRGGVRWWMPLPYARPISAGAETDATRSDHWKPYCLFDKATRSGGRGSFFELPLTSAGVEESKVSRPEWISVSMPYVRPGSRAGGDAWAAEAAQRGGLGTQSLLEVVELTPAAEVTEALQLDAETPVIVRRRLMMFDGQPVELTDSYYPAPIARGTALSKPGKIRGGAVSLLAELGYRPRRVTEDVYTRQPTESQRGALGLTAGEWVLGLTRVLSTAEGVPVELSVMTMVPHGRRLRYELTVE
ncbi:UTRA domain-containing protein [Micromonospora sp. NPDC051925]|uniref:UTRA domain-containing protein n=1 Tax=Micromonospora sp. NPDC051925 TaxID=3364288 RepID=UPI0037C73332